MRRKLTTVLLALVMLAGFSGVSNAQVSTVFPNGITTADQNGPRNTMQTIDPTRFFITFHDFAQDIDAATGDDQGFDTLTGLTVNNTLGSLIQSSTIANFSYGAVNFGLNPGEAGQAAAQSPLYGPVSVNSGKRAYFAARFRIEEPTSVNAVFGAQNIDTTPTVTNEGIYFLINGGSNLSNALTTEGLDFIFKRANSAKNILAITEVTPNTWTEVSWYFDGKTDYNYYVDGVAYGSYSATSTVYAPTEELALSVGIVNASNAATVGNGVDIDYVLYAKER